jgi:polyisoprenoid-binding protein YceI
MNCLKLSAFAAVAALTALPASGMAQDPGPKLSTDPASVQAGTYTLDPNHGRIVWNVIHRGLSIWYGDFARPTGTAVLDPKNPAADSVDITIPTASVSTTNAKLDGELKSPDWFDAEKFPTIHFKSTKVVVTGPGAADVTGDLTFHGVTKPVKLEVKFRAAGMDSMTKHYSVGFDAKTRLKRSDFGVLTGLPALGDDVHIVISAPFNKVG